QSVRDVAVRFGGVAHEGKLIACTSYKLGERVAELIPGGVAPDRVILRIGLRHLFRVVVAVKDSTQYWQRTRAYGPVVEVDLVSGDHELLAHFRPVGFFVRIVECSFRQLWRFLLEGSGPFRRQAPCGWQAKCTRCTSCACQTCKGRKKSTSIDHKTSTERQ